MSSLIDIAIILPDDCGGVIENTVNPALEAMGHDGFTRLEQPGRSPVWHMWTGTFNYLDGSAFWPMLRAACKAADGWDYAYTGARVIAYGEYDATPVFMQLTDEWMSQ